MKTSGNLFLLISRPIGENGRKEWHFELVDDELILARYTIGAHGADGTLDVLGFYERGSHGTVDPITIEVPAEVLREAIDMVPNSHCEGTIVYRGFSYSSAQEAIEENPNLFEAANAMRRENELRVRERTR
jgi:hypothetical protein